MSRLRRSFQRAIAAGLVAGAVLAAPAMAAPDRGDQQDQAADSGQRPAARKPRAMFDQWVQLWNGDFAKAKGIISPDFRVHAALLDGGDGSSIRGIDGLLAWIGQTRAPFTDLRFTPEVGPLVDGRYVSARWTATATYAGGFPGAKAKPGTVIAFTGTDTLRIERGKFAEYWVNSDTLQLLTQLQAL